ncbi:Pycsar system effector family protein [Erythrobacter sp. NFXS35]|uniref:Pycsar system effector family protein n=1 Tax=Erythrobacter sp. NFXS35 TaxID=2818436 RepID=UPI0032E05775
MQLVKFSPRWGWDSARHIGGQGVVQADQQEPALLPGESPATEPPSVLSAHTVQLIRTAQINTLTLSQMADQKAHILIGASFVVFSLVITQTGNGAINWSMMCLAATALFSTICAVIAILPRAGPKSIDAMSYNHLFFGHFALLAEDIWADEVLHRARQDESLYRMMLRDLYQNGAVLRRRKYRFLSYAYRIFLAGLGLTLLIYLLEASAHLARPGV